jgi:glutaredoxin
MQVTVHGKTEPECPFCKKTVTWLSDLGITFEYISYNDDGDRNDMYDHFGLEGKERTVPQIVVDGVRIGGFTALITSDVADRFSAGKFDEDF